MSKALFPGTFDPFTIGHEAIVKRTLTFMDEVVIAIVNNMEKNAMFPVEERVQQIRMNLAFLCCRSRALLPILP